MNNKWKWIRRKTDTLFYVGDKLIGQLFKLQRGWAAVHREPMNLGGPVNGFASRLLASEFLYQFETKDEPVSEYTTLKITEQTARAAYHRIIDNDGNAQEIQRVLNTLVRPACYNITIVGNGVDNDDTVLTEFVDRVT